MCLFLDIMKIASRLLISTSMALMLTAAAITVILSSTNLVTIANAQQEEQPSSPPAAINNVTSFQSTNDGFRLQVPQGWIIHDVNNTSSTLGMEVLEGYGILAQLCPGGEGQQQGAARPNTSNSRCQGAQGEVIHIIRYPNLGARLSFTIDDIINDFDDTANTILSYQMQKLREVGYSDIQIVNSTDARIPVDISLSGTNNDDDNDELPPASVAARLVEMTYRTTTASSAPSELKTGYYLLTASDVTPQDLGTMTGYSIFYEGTSSNAAAATIPAAVRQIFGSFELIATPEVAESKLAALAAQEELEEQAEETEQPEPEPEEPEPEEPEPEEPEPEEPPGNGTPGFIDLMDL